MRKSVKSALALLMAAIMLLCAAGCSSSDDSWSAKYDGETLPIGTYIYYLASASGEASSLVEDTEKDVLKQTVEGQDAEEWIRERAEYFVAYHYAVQKMMKERGLSLDETALQNAESGASSYWAQSSEILTDYGVAYESFKKAITLQYQEDAIFRSMYLAGGDKEVSDNEVKVFFEENYANFSVAPVYMYYYDEDDAYSLLSEDEQAELEASVQELLDQFNSGKIDMEKLTETLQDEKYHTYVSVSDETEFEFTNSVDTLDTTNDLDAVIAELENGKAAIYNTESGMLYILVKNDITEKTEEYLGDESLRTSLVAELKSEEFAALIDAEALALQDSIEFNTSAIEKQKISKFF